MHILKNILFIFLFMSIESHAQKNKDIIHTIINNYFTAIGGKERAQQVHTFASESVGTLDENQIVLTKKLMLPNLSTSSMLIGNQVISKNTFDGKKGMVMQHDDEVEFTSKELRRHKKNRCIFPEFDYLHTAKYLGIEKIAQSNCYVLQIENSKIYYSVNSGLKRKGISIQEKDGKTFLQELYFANYIEIEGLLFPTNLLMVVGDHKIEFQTRSIVINRDVATSDFKL